MEAIGRDTEVGLVSSASSHLAADSGHNHSSRARVGERWHGGGADRTAQQETARQRRNRPKWCRVCWLGVCKLDSCPWPHRSATVLAETEKGGVASSSCAGLRDDGGAAMAVPEAVPEAQGLSTFQTVGHGRSRGCSSNRVSPDTAPRVSGPRFFSAELFTPGEDCEYETHPATRAVANDEDSRSRKVKTVHFELVEDQEKPSWRLAQKTGKPFLLEPAYFHRCAAARVAARLRAGHGRRQQVH